jgi:Mg2+/Co2+ transporter CorC
VQEYKHEKLIATQTGQSAQELVSRMQQDSTHAIIGTLPARGEVFKINGLLFVVISKSDKQGTIHLEIMKPKKEKSEGVRL